MNRFSPAVRLSEHRLEAKQRVGLTLGTRAVSIVGSETKSGFFTSRVSCVTRHATSRHVKNLAMSDAEAASWFGPRHVVRQRSFVVSPCFVRWKYFFFSPVMRGVAVACVPTAVVAATSRTNKYRLLGSGEHDRTYVSYGSDTIQRNDEHSMCFRTAEQRSQDL